VLLTNLPEPGDPSGALVALDALDAEWEGIFSHHQEWLSNDPRFAYSVEEGQQLARASFLGWWRIIYPEFIQQYEVLTVEREIRALLAPGITLMARADGVIRERNTGLVYVLNWKTTSYKANWTQQWEDEIQPQTEAVAVEDSLSCDVAGVIFEGFYKGQQRDGIQVSPLIYGYTRMEGEVPLFSASHKPGWKRFAVWRGFHDKTGLEAIWDWVMWMPSDVLEEQYVRSAPILKNNEVVADWLEQVIRFELDVLHILESGSERDRELFFRQEFSKEHCRFCPFKPVCKKKTTIEQLLLEGVLKERVDHHGEAVVPQTSEV
jgi:hypothetical protein